MPDEITEKDEKAIAAEALDGSIADGDVEIEPVRVRLPVDQFPELKKDDEGDKVVMVMVGYAVKKTDAAMSVEFTRASLIHGKMTAAQKKKMMRLEDALKHKPGVDNPFALARHMVLRKKED